MILRNLKNNLQIVYMLSWVALSVIHFAILYGIYELDARAALADSAVFNLLFALIGSGLWFMVRYSDLQSRSFGELTFYHLSGAAVTILVWLGISYLILGNILKNDVYYHVFLRNTLTIRIITGIMFYALLVSIYYLLISFRELKEKSQREARLTSLLQEAELNLLRSQIRPHFLFNSLNSISALTMTDSARAQEMVIKLSEFMRYSLNFPDTMMSTFEREIHQSELYLDIEKVRFGERLVFEKEVDPESLNYTVPAMILQPLLENSVKHGVYESSGPTVIRLKGRIDNEVLEISVGNNYDPEAPARKGTGTGLRNISARLLNLYGTGSLLQVRNENDYFLVTIRIPRHAR